MVIVRCPPLARIAVIGSGHTGLCTGVAFARKGHHVVCVDVDSPKVEAILRGRAPFFEVGLDEEVARLRKRGRLDASTDATGSTRGSDFIFICVGTPGRRDGGLDPSPLQSAATAIGEGLRGTTGKLVVVKSTVLPGTTESMIVPTLESASGLGTKEFGVCVNPEFLREGQGLKDSVRPTHIVVGERDRPTGNALLRLYSTFSCPKFRTSIRVAEAVKYATNAFLATKVTFANELANFARRLGMDAEQVIRGMALDPRINPGHLQPGPGFGGSCLPKDVNALVGRAREAGYEPRLWSAVLEVNERQPLEVIRLLEEEVGDLSGKRIALLGLAFKAGTDDVRQSKALAIAQELLSRGASVVGYDPVAGDNFARALPGAKVVRSVEGSLRGAEACVIQADWPEFRRLGSAQFAAMAKAVVIDARRTWPPDKVPKGIRYRRIG